jgi:ribosomal protein L37AE/L43A
MTFKYKRTESGLFLCPHCNDYAPNGANQNTVHMHIRAKHSGNFKHKCKRCDFETSTEQTLQNHIAAKHPADLKEARIDFECPLDTCEYSCMTKGGLRSHYLLKHMGADVKALQEKTDAGAFKCKGCEKEFKSKPAFIYHVPDCLPDERFLDEDVQKFLEIVLF